MAMKQRQIEEGESGAIVLYQSPKSETQDIRPSSGLTPCPMIGVSGYRSFRGFSGPDEG